MFLFPKKTYDIWKCPLFRGLREVSLYILVVCLNNNKLNYRNCNDF